MIVRLRSREGMSRVSVEAADSLRTFLDKVRHEVKLKGDAWALADDPRAIEQITPTDAGLDRRTVGQEGIKHGTILHVIAEAAAFPERQKQVATSKTGKATAIGCPDAEELAVDIELSKRDIDMPSQSLYESGGVKHKSLHIHLRELLRGTLGSQVPPLEEPVYMPERENGARENVVNWSKMPSTIQLKNQRWRNVDYVEFESPGIVDKFVEFWRKSGGCQRVGFMYGTYAPYDEVPLGIKAVVSAIYEPPQGSSSNYIDMDDEDQHEAIADATMAAMGLTKVGWIITDLEAAAEMKVKYKRHVDSYFLASGECLMAADLQAEHPNATKFSSTGVFGSKFVTVVVSGDEENNVGIRAWQVSNQCVAMVDLLEASRDPSLAKMRQDSEAMIPDVLYVQKNEYNVDVTHTAQPTFPVEYLLVNLNAGSPQAPQLLFASDCAFPVENRENIAELQNTDALATCVLAANAVSGEPDKFLKRVADAHLLIFLAKTDVVPLQHHVPSLCRAIADNDTAFVGRLVVTDEWRTAVTLFEASAQTAHGATGGGGGGHIDDEKVQTMMDVTGMDRTTAMQTLQQFDGDISSAINSILG